MKKIELEIVALSHSITRTQSYAVILGEVNGLRRIPIVIGAFEAQAIAVALENMPISRPLTHDLMKNFMTAFQIDLHEVVISRLHEGVFYSQLVCSSENDTIEIDSRTSDALALAVRFGCPIYTYESVLETASNVTEIEETKEEEEHTESVGFGAPGPSAEELKLNLSNLSLEELHQKLAEVLENEDYLQAISIRDEISSRTNSGDKSA
jgi:bifunctional DNase/RNase